MFLIFLLLLDWLPEDPQRDLPEHPDPAVNRRPRRTPDHGQDPQVQ